MARVLNNPMRNYLECDELIIPVTNNVPLAIEHYIQQAEIAANVYRRVIYYATARKLLDSIESSNPAEMDQKHELLIKEAVACTQVADIMLDHMEKCHWSLKAAKLLAANQSLPIGNITKKACERYFEGSEAWKKVGELFLEDENIAFDSSVKRMGPFTNCAKINAVVCFLLAVQAMQNANSVESDGSEVYPFAERAVNMLDCLEVVEEILESMEFRPKDLALRARIISARTSLSKFRWKIYKLQGETTVDYKALETAIQTGLVESANLYEQLAEQNTSYSLLQAVNS